MTYETLQKRKLSDEENANEDEDEMLFVRGASPIRKDSQENNNSPRRTNEHENFDNNSDYEERPNINRHRENDSKRSTGRGGGGSGGGGGGGGGTHRILISTFLNYVYITKIRYMYDPSYFYYMQLKLFNL